MVAPIKPQKQQANGKDSWGFAPAIADMAAPTDTELNAVSGLNFTCFLLADQDGVASTSERVTLARLLCETGTQEALGQQTWSLTDLQIVFDPQADAAADGKKAFEQFRTAGSGYLWRRQNVAFDPDDGDVAADQYVDVFRVEWHQATPGKSNTDASGIYTAMVPVGLLGQEFNVAVVAGA